jgi:hypothetical protein
MNYTTLFIGVICGSIGVGYFIYGKKRRRFIPIIAGLGLIIVPYFLDNLVLLSIVCVVLCACPFVIRSD